jgi:hypothetical protein
MKKSRRDSQIIKAYPNLVNSLLIPNLVITALFLILCINSFGQVFSGNSLVSEFNDLDSNPKIINFSNTLEINNSGGHLQGIQAIETNEGKYFVLSGSSDSYSYYTVVKKGDKNEVISVNKLMDKPFKHAGGFQIFQNYMVVGIEDNDAKDKSKVCIYNISNPEKPEKKPVVVIERSGSKLRSTAGCVGMTRYKNKILLAVGDWDTKNIDFYSCKSGEFPNAEFDLFHSINIETISKENWTDKQWLSYQNINLFSFNDDELYLVGLGQNNKNENVADLYHLIDDGAGIFNITKTASKTFNCENEVSFKNGAGVEFSGGGELEIIACGYNIHQTSYLNYFSINKEKANILPAHSHNDYEHERPLFDALENNFKSIEADVFSIGDSLYVAHDFDKIKPGRTLCQLYLEPLKNEIEKNNGSVYGNGEEVILFIDIKDDGLKTYQNLHRILTEYKSHLTSFANKKKKQGSIMVVVSGNRPFEFMQSQTIRYAGFDGRIENLDSGILPNLMPVVSDNWAKYFSWDGTGKISEEEKHQLKNYADKAKNQGYLLRFWNTPNHTQEQRKAVWSELKNAEVGLIGVDELKELHEFLTTDFNKNN